MQCSAASLIATFAVCLSFSTAGADIVHVVLPPVVIPSGNSPDTIFRLDIDGSGNDDVSFIHTTGPAPNSDHINVSVIQGLGATEIAMHSYSSTNARSFAEGEAITGPWLAWGYFARANGDVITGEWADGESRYMALRFMNYATYQYHVAWMRVSVSLWSHTTVHEYAYRSTPGPLYAGQIPAPGAFGLFAISFAMRRRRRQDA